MPQNNKALKAEIKTMIGEINKKTGANISFTKLYEDVESALFPENAVNRDQDLLGLFTGGIYQLSEKPLARKSLPFSSPILKERYKDDPIHKYVLSEAATDMSTLIVKMITLQDPDTAKGFVWSKEQLDAVREYEQGLIRDCSYQTLWPKCIKEWDHQCFYKDIEDIDNTFNTNDLAKNQYRYDRKRNNDMDFKAAELFYKSDIIQKEVDSYGFFTRLFNRIFNRRKMAAYDAYLAKAKETLEKIGFNPERDGERALGILAGKIMPPHEQALEAINEEREQRDAENEQKVLDLQNEIAKLSNDTVTEQQVNDLRNQLYRDSEALRKQVEEEYFRTHGTSDSNAQNGESTEYSPLFKDW